MRILITSDNHLGYKETDSIRGDDTFRTFEEILGIAKSEKVDLVLQGGDLFEENKPSRNTYNKILQLLRTHCFGLTAPTIQTEHPVNWHSASICVSLPIFSIHGNHDDPSGFGTVSPHDILASAGLLNYFGKVSFSEDGRITLSPILLQQVNPETNLVVRVAIYGLGYLNNRHIYRLFTKGLVEYNRPSSDGWYNILMVHQNRVPRESEYLPEDSIAPFFDLVIYGHEHESIRFSHKNFDVIQPGSTVRTSLTEGESHSKYVYILDLSYDSNNGITRSIEKIELKTVRSFIMDSIKIRDGNPDSVIQDKVTDMMRYSQGENECNLLPLLRLRVELIDVELVNKHSLLSTLNGKVANPGDFLKIVKRTERKISVQETRGAPKSIFDIYSEILKKIDFDVLQEPDIISSFQNYLKKEDKHAFESMVTKRIEKITEHLDPDGIVLENVTEMIHRANESMRREEKREDAEISLGLEEQIEQDIQLEYANKSASHKDTSTLSFLTECSTKQINSTPLEHQRNYTFIEMKEEEKSNGEMIKRIKNEETDDVSGDSLILF